MATFLEKEWREMLEEGTTEVVEIDCHGEVHEVYVAKDHTKIENVVVVLREQNEEALDICIDDFEYVPLTYTPMSTFMTDDVCEVPTEISEDAPQEKSSNEE